MKKLMIAAATAAMIGGAYADPCTPDTPSTDCAAVYKVTMNLKTTKGIAQDASTSGSQCAPGVTGCTVLRTKDSTKIEGWIYECTCGCETIKSGTVVTWDSKRKASFNSTGAFDWTVLNVMGKKQNEAEAAWLFSGTVNYDDDRAQSYSLTGAGYGKFSTSKNLYTSFSGNLAGTVTAPFDLKTSITKNACACDPSQIWACTALSELIDADSIAYGTWSIKYDSSASKKYLSNGYIKVPSYVTLPDAE